MKEFDPETERHYPLITVKAVEPGCTTEWQFENCQTGEIHRVTTTESADNDEITVRETLLRVFQEAWEAYGHRHPEDLQVGTTATSGAKSRKSRVCKRCGALKDDHIVPFSQPNRLKCPTVETQFWEE